MIYLCGSWKVMTNAFECIELRYTKKFNKQSRATPTLQNGDSKSVVV